MTPADRPRRRKPPLAAHRWFVPFVAMWFAALFGLSILVLPPALLERIVAVLGIDRVFAAAAPPLGETARLLIAAAASSVGEILGLLVGRAVARPHRAKRVAEPRDAEPVQTDDAPNTPFVPRKPLSAPDDLADIDDVPLPAVSAIDPQSAAQPDSEPLPFRPALATAALFDLGIVQLSERLALAMNERRAQHRLPSNEPEEWRAEPIIALPGATSARFHPGALSRDSAAAARTLEVARASLQRLSGAH